MFSKRDRSDYKQFKDTKELLAEARAEIERLTAENLELRDTNIALRTSIDVRKRKPASKSALKKPKTASPERRQASSEPPLFDNDKALATYREAVAAADAVDVAIETLVAEYRLKERARDKLARYHTSDRAVFAANQPKILEMQKELDQMRKAWKRLEKDLIKAEGEVATALKALPHEKQMVLEAERTIVTTGEEDLEANGESDDDSEKDQGEGLDDFVEDGGLEVQVPDSIISIFSSKIPKPSAVDIKSCVMCDEPARWTDQVDHFCSQDCHRQLLKA